jgi:hypothetical protein
MRGLLICGLGAQPKEEFSLETLEALERCAAVYSDLGPGEDFRWLSRLLPKLKSLTDPAAVVARARKELVGAAVWGHPRASSGVGGQLAALCARGKIDYRLLASVSPLGNALSQALGFAVRNWGHLGLDCQELGHCLSGASRVLPAVSTVIYCAGARPGAWSLLHAALRGGYPPDHKVWFLGGEGRAAVQFGFSELARWDGGAGSLILPARVR